MKAIIREWTDEEKKKMTQIAGKVCDIFTKETDDDSVMIANILDMMRDSYYENIGIMEAKRVDNNLKDVGEFSKKFNHIQQLIIGMGSSNISLLVFYPDDDVWMQYHMCKFLNIPTFVICREEHRHEMAPRIVKGGNIIDILVVDDIDANVIEKFTETALNWSKENSKAWKKEKQKFK